MTDTRPRLKTPTGGTMSHPSSPAQWHGHPYVWAWYATSGSLDTRYIEERCKEAEEAGASADAVYKTSPSNNVAPDTWVTLEQLAGRFRPDVEAYGKALLAWQAALEAHRGQRQVVQPVSQMEPPAGETAVGAGRGVKLVRRPEQEQ